MPESKTQPTSASVDEFLDGIADPTRREDCRTVAAMMQAATGEPPVMWGEGIVGFARYRYHYASGRSGDWPIVGFSPRKNDLTLYLMPGFDGREVLLEKLGKHKTGKACLYLKRLSDVDPAVLQQLIAASVKAMAKDRVA